MPGRQALFCFATACVAAASLCYAAQDSAALERAAQDARVSAQARALYERSRESVAQIRVLLGSSGTHAATGTGFVIGADGSMLTNYHVVADKALEPETYRLEFVLHNGRRGNLQIVAVDVVHDLAIVRGDLGAVEALTLRETPLAKGEKGFALGHPLNQGLTVVEGIYNGRSEEQYYERIHFTGAINSGMSGGPALDERGRVFGVNVATHRRGQLVSFLVPGKFAAGLITRSAAVKPPYPADFSSEVGAQLRAHNADLMGTMLAKKPLPTQQLGEFRVPDKIGESMQCGAGTERESVKLYTVDTYQCFTYSALYVDPRLQTGMLSFRHRIMRSDKLGALRFAYLQESQFGSGRSGDSFVRKHYTRYACRDRIVALDGTRAKMAMCVRRYKRFEGLYDVSLKIVSLGSPAVALQSELDMEGVAYDDAMAFARNFLGAIKWSR
jgi:serine protease Do